MGCCISKSPHEPNGSCSRWIAKKTVALRKDEAIDAFDKLDVHCGMTVLELGPGEGDSLHQILAKDPAKVYAIETSKYFRRSLAKKPLFKEAIRSNLLELSGDSLNVPIEKETVDRILAINVLYLLDPQVDKEMFRVIKPGGKMLWCIKDKVDRLDHKASINWNQALVDMHSAGFTVSKGSERLGKNHRYTVLQGVKPEIP